MVSQRWQTRQSQQLTRHLTCQNQHLTRQHVHHHVHHHHHVLCYPVEDHQTDLYHQIMQYVVAAQVDMYLHHLLECVQHEVLSM